MLELRSRDRGRQISVPAFTSERTVMPHYAICVPVRNEAERLPRFLQSVANLSVVSLLSPKLFLALDSCSDASEEIVRNIRSRGFPFEIDLTILPFSNEPNAGRARQAAMAAAYGAYQCSADLRLLTTDADSVLAVDWLLAHENAFTSADLVAGYVKRLAEQPNELRDALEAYLERLHQARRMVDPIAYDAHQTHPYTSGASLGITGNAYDRIGGMPTLATGEDGAFVDLGRRGGLRVRQDKAVRVWTSERRNGRAKFGLADALHDLDRKAERDEAILVEDPRSAIWQYRRHAASRQAHSEIWNADDACAHARLMHYDEDMVVNAWRTALSADAFVMMAVPMAPPSEPIALATAVTLLDGVESSLLKETKETRR